MRRLRHWGFRFSRNCNNRKENPITSPLFSDSRTIRVGVEETGMGMVSRDLR
jgi:hypothetical protein